MKATANDLINSTYQYETVMINGLEVQVRSLNASETIKFSKLINEKADNIEIAATLIKWCCGSFNNWAWPVWRIKKKLPLTLLTELSNKILEISGYGENAVENEVKN